MDTPGTILKREREARGVSLREIASITRIPVTALRNIEEDRFEKFPAEVFAKGFLRNYAREINVSGDDVILAYEALKQQQLRHDVGYVAPEPPPIPAAAKKKSVADTPKVSRKAMRSVRKERTPKRSETAVNPLVLASPNGEAAAASPTAAGVESSQRTFRFAYLIVFLVVVTSLGLSVLFTGTGEAEENSPRKARPVVDTKADESSRWLMDDQKLTAKPKSATETWSRPAFPEDDHE